MNVLSKSTPLYSVSDVALKPLRTIEYDLFASVSRKLTAAWPQRRSNFAELVKAVDENRTLWRTLAVDVAAPGNTLPASLRAQLFYLYEFVDQHSEKILSDSASVEVLVDVNMAIMRGLRGEGGNG